jgi:hypothetical protein
MKGGSLGPTVLVGTMEGCLLLVYKSIAGLSVWQEK